MNKIILMSANDWTAERTIIASNDCRVTLCSKRNRKIVRNYSDVTVFIAES